MQQNPMMQEPPISPDDTSPSAVVSNRPTTNGLGLLVRAILFLAAAGLTAAAALVYIGQGNTPTPTPPPAQVVIVTRAVTPTSVPTQPPPTENPLAADSQPAPDVLAALLAIPADSAPAADVMYRQQSAFTIAPPGPRGSVMQYTIRLGDTIEGIAKNFRITENTIIWNNDVGFINRLEVGTQLTILPVDGVLYTPTADETIQAIADKFKVSPYAILNSEYNKLQSATPSFLVPANTLSIMIPGGITKKDVIYWKPTISTRPASGPCTANCGSGTNKDGDIVFGGGPGSCGYQHNGGGDGSLGLPFPPGSYTVIRGFLPWHSGIDLAKPTGLPVFAAGAGTVIFAGWSDWGYGYSIVIAHTPTLMTLYGHLSRINVSCGQFVSRAQLIGAVGTSGNSTGPHLHFEIRINQVPVNPISVMGGF